MKTFGLRQDDCSKVVVQEELYQYERQQQFRDIGQQHPDPYSHVAEQFFNTQRFFMPMLFWKDNDFPFEEWKLQKGPNATYKELIHSYLVVNDKPAAVRVCRFLQKFCPVSSLPPTLPVLLAVGKPSLVQGGT